MTRINSARLRSVETHRARLRDPRLLNDHELNEAIAEELGISPEEVEAMSDDELEKIASREGMNGNEQKPLTPRKARSSQQGRRADHRRRQGAARRRGRRSLRAWRETGEPIIVDDKDRSALAAVAAAMRADD